MGFLASEARKLAGSLATPQLGRCRRSSIAMRERRSRGRRGKGQPGGRAFRLSTLARIGPAYADGSDRQREPASLVDLGRVRGLLRITRERCLPMPRMPGLAVE